MNIQIASLSKRIGADAFDYGFLALTILLVVFLVPIPYRYLYYPFLYLFLIVPVIVFKGQSIGKRLLNIKIVSYPSKANLTLMQIHYREILKFILVILSFIKIPVISNIFAFSAVIFFLINSFLVMENPDKRGIHDYLAKTIVIDLSIKEKIIDPYEY